ncbi:MAG: DUF2268 domain-containing putative Zn-dependent protease [Myxococcales bacterium]|nr:DUF2268 domain-containing putative Zn-dependent protease [Myxococcales bacterium]
MTRPSRRGALGALLVVLLSQCGGRGDDGSLQVKFYRIDGETISRPDRRVIEAIARDAVSEARRHLPQLPTPVVIRVQPEIDTGLERGENGTASQPNMVLWTVDPHHAGGVRHVAKTWLRTCLLHELHHLVRDAAVARTTMLDFVVSEGMATAFQRDLTHAVPPWGKYTPDAAPWVEELRGLPTDPDHRRMWLRRHPDGRRWIGYKAGTYLVDRATRNSGRSPADLVTTSTREVLRLAGSP